MKKQALIVSIILCSIKIVYAQNAVLPQQDVITIQSGILKKEMKIWVQKPVGYDTIKNDLPVLFVLNPDWDVPLLAQYVQRLNNPYTRQIPACLVVGLSIGGNGYLYMPEQSGNLRYDTLKTRRGQAAEFTAYIETEVWARIKASYRVSGFKVLLAHSYPAMFALYAMCLKPNFFNAVIASSPALHNAPLLVKKYFPDLLKKNTTQHLFFTVGENDYPGFLSEAGTLKDSIAAHVGSDFKWKFEYVPKMNHATIAAYTYYRGLLEVFVNPELKN